MRRPFALCSLLLVGGLLGGATSGLAADTEKDKGAKIYCFMRASGNDHTVSWNAAYAVIKRQGRSMFKTSPEHASVMITEAVVKSPDSYPDCGRYLGDLFGGSKNSTAAIQSSRDTTSNSALAPEASSTPIETNERYSY